MISRDLTRILRGAKMVADAAVKANANSVPYDRFKDHAIQIYNNIQQHYQTETIDDNSLRNVPNRSVEVEKEHIILNNKVPVPVVEENHVVYKTTPAAVTDIVIEKSHEQIKELQIDPVGFDSINIDSIPLDYKALRKSEVIMREKTIPSTQFSRLIGFGSLGFRMAMGIASEKVFDAFTGSGGGGGAGPKSALSDENAERLAETLCRMRGAALKLGQMLSIQDQSMLPPSLAKALQRVQQYADHMPPAQLYAQLVSQLGTNWRTLFLEFDEKPIAAASIGQVHRAVTLDGSVVAVKIQYPGVADSIKSDLSNLKSLVTVTNILPKGLFIDEIIQVASVELSEECDYVREASSQQKYKDFVNSETLLSRFILVPKVYEHLSTRNILTTQFVEGVSIEKTFDLPQNVRNAIARTMLILTMKELFQWRFVQSDPNFGNYLYDHENKRIACIDFGASREYSKDFVDGYMKLVWAASNEDRETVFNISRDLGFLTGDENEEMCQAHVSAALVVGEPFINDAPYDFGNSQLTSKISQYGSTFMKYRLTPPPTEAYSLHRKLAGAFMLCIKLRAVIPCRDILIATYEQYKFDTATSSH